MPDDLRSAIQTVRGGAKEFNFGIIEGSPEHGFMVTMKKIAGPVLAALQKQSGKTVKAIVGTLSYDPELKKLIFRTPGPVPAKLKALLKEAATQQTVSLGAYGVASGDPAAFKARLGPLLTDLSRVLSLTTPNAAKVQKLNNDVKAAATAEDFARAITLLDELEPLVRSELAAHTAAQVPPDAPQAEPPQPDPAARTAAVPPPPPLSLDALRAALSKMDPAVQQAVKGRPERKNELLLAVARCQQELKTERLAEAKVALLAVARLLKGLAPPSDQAAPAAAPAPGGAAEPIAGAGLKAWQQAAQQARYQLRRLQLAVKLIEHPTASQVLDLLDGLVQRLEKDPATPADLKALEEYLRSDDVITSAETPNPFGAEVKIREPLLSALEQLKAHLVPA